MTPPIVLYDPPERARTDYRIGLSAWTDKSMLEEGQFYPRNTMSPEERLWWYAQYFDVVEMNSSFYAIPPVETARFAKNSIALTRNASRLSPRARRRLSFRNHGNEPRGAGRAITVLR